MQRQLRSPLFPQFLLELKLKELVLRVAQHVCNVLEIAAEAHLIKPLVMYALEVAQVHVPVDA